MGDNAEVDLWRPFRAARRAVTKDLSLFQAVVLLVVLSLTVGHSLWPAAVRLNAPIVAMLTLGAVIALAPILASAELPGGAKFRFRKQIKRAEGAEEAVERRIQRESHGVDVAAVRPFYHQPGIVNLDDDVRALAHEQPAAALGVLRSAIWSALRDAVSRLRPGLMNSDRTSELIEILEDTGKFWPEQIALLRVLVEATDGALLSGAADVSDAQRLIGLADTLDLSFPVGYSPNFEPNDAFEEQGLICEYEHCIENMPLPGVPRSERVRWRNRIRANLKSGDYDDDPKRKALLTRMAADPIPKDAPEEVDTTGSCPIFGHFCPGGPVHVAGCEPAGEWVASVSALEEDGDGST